jgi:uncharacterized circularly permuted ATP-grasp superfamily protein
MSGVAEVDGRPWALEEYEPSEGAWDEAFLEPGVPRQHYRQLLADLEGSDPGRLADAARTAARLARVRFGTDAGVTSFVYDPVPRIFPGSEWERLELGLAQRVRALNLFLADAYGEGRMVAAGRMPARAVDAADHREPAMDGVPVPGGVHAAVAGLDLVRDAHGEILVLEDNLRTPSGLAYTAAARGVVEAALPEGPLPARRPADLGFDALGRALRAAAPEGIDDPHVVLLTDGPRNSAWYEHETIARRAGIPLVRLVDLETVRGEVRVRGDSRRVDVIYRRTDGDRLHDRGGRLTALGQALLEPIRSGRLACVNAFGCGVADDKLAHAYVEEMVRFFLDEEPLLRSVPTYDLGEPEQRAEALERLPELVIKPRSGFGGHGVVIGPRTSKEELDHVARSVRERPERYVAQETVLLSCHPTACDRRVEPRHVDLRPFIISGGNEVTVVPGGLTRVAFGRGELVVNSSQNGGAKDTWVLT